MFAFVWYLAFPLFLLWLLGSKGAFGLGLAFVVILVVLAVGFITGLLFTWFVEPQSYWHAYELPKLMTNTYTDSLSLDDPMYKVLVIPYITLYDGLRIYVHFSLTHGTPLLWIPEIVSFIILRNLYLIYWHARRLLESS